MIIARSVSCAAAAFGLAAIGLAASAARADVRMPALFSDHMVLQCDLPAPVWGWAEAGETVAVSIGDQRQTATAGKDGRWSVKLAPLKSGGPMVMKVQGKNALEIKDVLVGEVWLCSGQSNMGLPVFRAADFEKEKAAAHDPRLRVFNVAQVAKAEPADDVQGKWVVCSPETVRTFSATAYFFGRRLRGELDKPVGLITSSWGGTTIESWTALSAMESVGELRFFADKLKKDIAEWTPEAAQKRDEARLARWKKAMASAKESGKKTPRKPTPEVRPESDYHRAASLFNGMIAPLVPYGIRGVIWYQGENNADTWPAGYGVQLQTMIADWRARWNNSDLPFIFVQLPNFSAPQKEPVETNGWTTIRDRMFHVFKSVPNTGMAVTIDVGEADNVHPVNKQAVGSRLAQWALAKVYGKDIVASGPIYQGMNVKEGKLVCRFEDVGGGLVAKGGALEGFAVAGKDKKFHWAKAAIEGDAVIVTSDEVSAPVAVRYSWAENPKGNLFNKAGLPASPFRSDDWAE